MPVIFGRPNEMEAKFAALTEPQQASINKFVIYMQGQKYSQKTINQYKFYLTHLFIVTQKDCLSMQKDDLLDFVSKMSGRGLQLKPITNGSLKTLYSVLNSFFRFHDRGDLNLVRKNVRGGAPEERQIFSLAERDAFFAKTEEMHHLKIRTLFEFSYWEALRINEAIEMKPENIDFARNLVHIKAGKGNKDATIDLLPKAKQILQRYMSSSEYEGNAKHLFVYEYKKGKFAGEKREFYFGRIEHLFQKTLFALNMGKLMSFHCLRHSCGSHLLAAMGEAGLPFVQRHLRHQKGSPVTLRYLHVLDKTISAEALQRIGGI